MKVIDEYDSVRSDGIISKLLQMASESGQDITTIPTERAIPMSQTNPLNEFNNPNQNMAIYQ